MIDEKDSNEEDTAAAGDIERDKDGERAETLGL